MNRSMLALIAVAAVAAPILAWSDDNPNAASPQAAQGGDRHGGGMWRHEGMRQGMLDRMGWGANRTPQQMCEERLARRAGFVAYIGARLNLTPEQKPLWDKVQAATQTAQYKQRELCSTLKPAAERGQETVLDRMAQREQRLTARLQGLQQVEPAVQALYQALTPEQKAIVDHPFRRG